MQFMIPFCFLCVVVLQQIINVTSINSFERYSDNVIRRIPISRRLRAPLMGRSITTAFNDSNEINNNGQKELIELNKRRYGLALLGRRRWMGLKRRGPLFG